MFNSLSAADSDRASRWAALAICATSAALCLWLLVRIAWLFVPRSIDSSAALPLAPNGVAQSAATSIAQWHLFGNAQAPELGLRLSTAPKSSLKLGLRGTLALSDPKQGLAIIADERNVERKYNVGDQVGGAKLVEVYADHVVLNHDGVAETLDMPRPEDRAPGAPGDARVSAAAGVPAGAKPGSSSRPQAPARSAAATDVAALARLSPADIARQVQFEPVFDGGKLSGARLSGSGAVGALMSRAGLRASDVVTAVNGTPLASVSNPQDLIDKFGNASSVQITVQRDGKPATLTVNLR